MHTSRRALGRTTAVLVFFAGLIAAGASTSAVLAEPGSATFELCVGCPGCKLGDCDGAPERGHDHCCASTCWSHTAWLLSAPGSVSEPPSERSRPVAHAPGSLEQPAGSVFHPPRR